jgi:copper oxidase (laccase) domain-containing protein
MSQSSQNIIGQLHSGRRYLSCNSVLSSIQQHHKKEAKAELVFNANMIVAGSACKVLELTE